MKYLIPLLLVSSIAFADLPESPRFTWTNPTQYTDGTPLNPATELAEIKVHCTGAMTFEGVVSTMPVVEEFLTPTGVFADGNYVCHYTSVDILGRESEPSNPTREFTVGAAPPPPPPPTEPIAPAAINDLSVF